MSPIFRDNLNSLSMPTKTLCFKRKFLVSCGKIKMMSERKQQIIQTIEVMVKPAFGDFCTSAYINLPHVKDFDLSATPKFLALCYSCLSKFVYYTY